MKNQLKSIYSKKMFVNLFDHLFILK